ncbi:hypothetical protein [Nostoc sp. C117]|uniref:hypothetical protein n=1 Tax=Nostoc sp. C117 TaxID=3349875 RepID=UPI00370DBC3D
MDKSFVYVRGSNISEVVDMHSQGVKILCPVCMSELLIIPDGDMASKHHMAPGVYCPVSKQHVHIKLFLSRKNVWKRVKEIMQEELDAKD